MVLASSFKDNNFFFRAVVLFGKKPSKINLSVGAPEAESAEIAALAPGMATTLIS